MISQPKESLPFGKGPVEKSLPVDQSPVFDRAEDFNNEDFVNANDPERKFIPINEVEDKESDFTDGLDDEGEEKEVREPADEQKELEKVRKDIGHYDYKGPDSESMPLASFHVDHDNEEVIAIVEEGLEPVKATNPETIEDAPLEEELVDNNIVTDRKMSPGGLPLERVGRFKVGQSNVSDNLKTRSDSKIQRDNRGLIRKFLDNVWNKN